MKKVAQFIPQIKVWGFLAYKVLRKNINTTKIYNSFAS